MNLNLTLETAECNALLIAFASLLSILSLQHVFLSVFFSCLTHTNTHTHTHTHTHRGGSSDVLFQSLQGKTSYTVLVLSKSISWNDALTLPNTHSERERDRQRQTQRDVTFNHDFYFISHTFFIVMFHHDISCWLWKKAESWKMERMKERRKKEKEHNSYDHKMNGKKVNTCIQKITLTRKRLTLNNKNKTDTHHIPSTLLTSSPVLGWYGHMKSTKSQELPSTTTMHILFT